MPQEKSCGTLVFRKENNAVRYLLLHYNEGHWEFPKGHVEKNETEEQTALRELKEETGISDAKIEPSFRHTINYFFKNEGKTIYKEVVFFLASTDEEKVSLSNEHIGFEWLSFDGAMKRLKFKNSKDVLTKAKEFVEKNFL